jgi:hypothetical protein
MKLAIILVAALSLTLHGQQSRPESRAGSRPVVHDLSVVLAPRQFAWLASGPP